MHIVMTVNAAWNIVNFRTPVLRDALAQGHQVTVLAPPDDSVAKITEMGARFVPLAMDVKGLSPRRDAGLVLRMRRHFKALKPDAVFSYTIKNNIYGAFAARGLDLRFIPNVTGLGTAFLSGGLLERVAETLYRKAFRGLPIVFFQNDDDRALFETRKLIAPHQVRQLPGSGIDLSRFAPAIMPTTPPVTFLLIARMLRDKGVAEFAAAAKQVRAAHPEARFVLLGPMGSANRSAISGDEIAAWEASGDVTYLPPTDDVRPHIANASCVVLPSYREGAPRTLIEAAAMARPLIATDVPGCRAVVDAPRTGLLCAARDAGSLAQAMLRFLALPPEAQAEMGQAGRAKMVAEYDEARVIEAYRAALEAT